MMLRTGDLNLNQFGDPVKEAVKRTMLQHEIVFKNQVRELHRLYWTQKNLMRELYRRELEAKGCKQTVPPQSFVAGSAKEGNVCSLEEIKGKFVGMSDNRHRGFNLELSADAYVVNSAKNSIGDELVISSEIVRPQSVDEKRGGMLSLLDKGKNLYCYEVIDLEEPVEVEPRVKAHGISFSGFKVPAGNCQVMGGSQSDIASDMASSSKVQNESGFVPYSSREEAGFVLDLNQSHSDCSERWQEHKADHSGAGGSESSVAGFVDLSTESTHKQELNSSKPMLIDLNIRQGDDASHAVNDPMLTFSSPSSSSSVIQNELWRDQGNKYLKETSAALNSEAPYSASGGKSMDWLFPGCQDSQRSKVSNFGTKQENDASNKVQESNSTGLTECCRKSAEGFSSGSNGEVQNNANGGTVFSSGDFNMPIEENEDLSSGGLHSITHSDRKQTSVVLASHSLEDKQANRERCKEDTVSCQATALDENQQDGLDGKLFTGSKADVPNGSTECSFLENSETTQLDNMVVESSLDQDHAVVDAAEILASISLTQPLPPMKQLDCTGLGGIVTKEDERDQPQYSSNSFENMTLELPEVRSDEHPTPTMVQIEGDAGEAASTVNKLRRGRGRLVRDFQKDILPGMVSLSRHEICEDMHSIGYELRKNGSRRVGGGNWFVPVRSRRSRRCPAGRRQ